MLACAQTTPKVVVSYSFVLLIYTARPYAAEYCIWCFLANIWFVDYNCLACSEPMPARFECGRSKHHGKTVYKFFQTQSYKIFYMYPYFYQWKNLLYYSFEWNLNEFWWYRDDTGYIFTFIRKWHNQAIIIK